MCDFFRIFANTMDLQQIIDHAVEVLKCGGTLLYPTDTIWGIGCDARRADAVERLYAIKGRDRTKSMLVLVDNEWWPEGLASRPTTYILPRCRWESLLGGAVADNLPAADGSLGIRVADHPFCRQVVRRLGAPLVSTSANLSGRPSPRCHADIEGELRRRVDWCVPLVPEWESGQTQGSRIVRLSDDGRQEVIRP